MLTKSEFLASLKKEAAITDHLVLKARPEHLGFRFTPKQRSTQELIEYLAIQLAGMTAHFIEGTWDRWGSLEAAVKGITPATFPAANARQIALVEQLLAGVSDAEFTTRTGKTPTEAEVILAEGLAEFALKMAVGYKMQLFLQLKAAGLHELVTSNLWFGADPQAAKA